MLVAAANVGADAAGAERTAPTSASWSIAVPEAGANVSLGVTDTPASFAVSAPARSVYEGEYKSGGALAPSFAAVAGPVMPSLEMVRWRGLAFEEGTLAAVEAKLEEAAAEKPAPRPAFLAALAIKLRELFEKEERASSRETYADAQAFAAVAIMLARADGKLPAEVALAADVVNRATADKDKFLKDDIFARAPAGYGAWDAGLKRLYAASLWLGKDFPVGDEKSFRTAVALAWAISSDPALSAQYKYLAGWARAAAGFPADRSSVEDYYGLLGGRDAPAVLREVGTVQKMQTDARAKGAAFVFLPTPSEAEVALTRRFVAAGAMGGATWADGLMAAIAAGTRAPKPAADAGFGDYGAYAWAALVTAPQLPESRKLAWDEGYIKRLGESYRFGFDQIRTRGGPPPPATALGGGTALAIEVKPQLRVEPLPEYYLRWARAYARLEKALNAAFPTPALSGISGKRDGGKAAEPSLAAEAAAIKELYYGLYLISCADIGMAPAGASELGSPSPAAARAAAWMADWRNDADMKRDIREVWALGPADPNDPKKGTVYRCVLGVRALDIDVKYGDKKPSTSLRNTSKTVSLRFKPAKYTLLVPVVAEITVAGETPLTRADLRKICDEKKSREEITAALKAFGASKPEAPKAPPPKPKKAIVDKGAALLLGLLGVFALIILIAVLAGRSRDKYEAGIDDYDDGRIGGRRRPQPPPERRPAARIPEKGAPRSPSPSPPPRPSGPPGPPPSGPRTPPPSRGPDKGPYGR